MGETLQTNILSNVILRYFPCVPFKELRILQSSFKKFCNHLFGVECWQCCTYCCNQLRKLHDSDPRITRSQCV